MSCSLASCLHSQLYEFFNLENDFTMCCAHYNIVILFNNGYTVHYKNMHYFDSQLASAILVKLVTSIYRFSQSLEVMVSESALKEKNCLLQFYSY